MLTTVSGCELDVGDRDDVAMTAASFLGFERALLPSAAMISGRSATGVLDVDGMAPGRASGLGSSFDAATVARFDWASLSFRTKRATTTTENINNINTNNVAAK